MAIVACIINLDMFKISKGTIKQSHMNLEKILTYNNSPNMLIHFVNTSVLFVKQ